ncbi:Spore maturation protein SpmA [Ruminobacter amylophilus]|uniref:Spore maturation protein SpmA n=2 Tax=Ruminobacter amylophilus TaxID=867 RepID=A0A662ZEH4_9GAMM|nr:Spore maturation protein SpmA [Ruminobacter amylophilus]
MEFECMINKIWGGMIVLGIISALIRCLVTDDMQIDAFLQEFFSSADLSVKVIIGLLGMTCLWMGIASIMESAGLTAKLARVLEPLFRVIMPDIPKGHPAIGSITMNMSANMLGLDNAATPFGIRAMKDMQTLNGSSDTASNSQIMFLVINTSAITIFPVSIIMYRTQFGSASPTDVFLPLLLTSAVSTTVGFLVTALIQKINIFKVPVLAAFVFLAGLIAGLAVWAVRAGENLASQATVFSDVCMVGFVGAVTAYAMFLKKNVFEDFVKGARQGFGICIDILPYLVAMLFAIAVFRSSGLLELITGGLKWLFGLFLSDTAFTDALPVGLVRPLSGSGARAMLLDVFKNYGPDSLQGHIASIMQGSTETTLYVIAVYFGSVGITRVRHAVFCGLMADLASVIAAVVIGYMFFG